MPMDSEGRAQRGEWTFTPPASMAPLGYVASFSVDEFAALQRGLELTSSDDKWFIYWHDDRLWIHRSWTGFLTYIIAFRVENGRHVVAETQVSTDPAQYGGRPADEEQQFLDWLLRNLVLGDERVEMPIPAELLDSEGAAESSAQPLRERRDTIATAWNWIARAAYEAARPLLWIARVAYEAARPLLRWLTRPRPRLTEVEVAAIVAEHIRGHGLNWAPKIQWISDPPVAYVSLAHRDGPTHDFVEADPFFVDRADGMVTELELGHFRRAYAEAQLAAPPGSDVTAWMEQKLYDPRGLERWAQICLSGTHTRYRFLPTKF